jgi:hypothetical protein
VLYDGFIGTVRINVFFLWSVKPLWPLGTTLLIKKNHGTCIRAYSFLLTKFSSRLSIQLFFFLRTLCHTPWFYTFSRRILTFFWISTYFLWDVITRSLPLSLRPCEVFSTPDQHFPRGRLKCPYGNFDSNHGLYDTFPILLWNCYYCAS